MFRQRPVWLEVEDTCSVEGGRLGVEPGGRVRTRLQSGEPPSSRAIKVFDIKALSISVMDSQFR
jgi:hypothetical protein